MKAAEKITNTKPITDNTTEPTEAKDNTQLTAEEQKELSEELYQKLLLSYKWNDFFFG